MALALRSADDNSFRQSDVAGDKTLTTRRSSASVVRRERRSRSPMSGARLRTPSGEAKNRAAALNGQAAVAALLLSHEV